MSQSSADSQDEPRLVLHAGMTNVYFVMILLALINLVAIAGQVYKIWHDGLDRGGLPFFAGLSLMLILMIAYMQRKARWLIARPRGLSIIERRGTRVVPWRDVRVVDDLGYWGGGPRAKRYYLELRDGYAFTFLGDPEQMARLASLRDGWTSQSSAERAVAAKVDSK